MLKTRYMVHGQGEFVNTLVGIFPTDADAQAKKAEHPGEWQVSPVKIEEPFALVTEVPFTPSN